MKCAEPIPSVTHSIINNMHPRKARMAAALVAATAGDSEPPMPGSRSWPAA